ncbi:MAG: hypothetical protein Q8L71_10155 [Thiobacillus sp.]|nr:hypothetical protein [Thiobacillus sp.]
MGDGLGRSGCIDGSGLDGDGQDQEQTDERPNPYSDDRLEQAFCVHDGELTVIGSGMEADGKIK